MGHFWSEIWEFAKTAVTEIGKAIGVLSPAYAGCGGAAVADGPLPIGDIIGAAGAILLTVGAIGYGIYQATQAPSISIPKAEEKEKDIYPEGKGWGVVSESAFEEGKKNQVNPAFAKLKVLFDNNENNKKK